MRGTAQLLIGEHTIAVLLHTWYRVRANRPQPPDNLTTGYDSSDSANSVNLAIDGGNWNAQVAWDDDFGSSYYDSFSRGASYDTIRYSEIPRRPPATTNSHVVNQYVGVSLGNRAGTYGRVVRRQRISFSPSVRTWSGQWLTFADDPGFDVGRIKDIASNPAFATARIT